MVSMRESVDWRHVLPTRPKIVNQISSGCSTLSRLYSVLIYYCTLTRFTCYFFLSTFTVYLSLFICLAMHPHLLFTHVCAKITWSLKSFLCHGRFGTGRLSFDMIKLKHLNTNRVYLNWAIWGRPCIDLSSSMRFALNTHSITFNFNYRCRDRVFNPFETGFGWPNVTTIDRAI